MGKLYDGLQKQLQLKSEKYKKDAEDCLKIYEKLKELSNGHVWDSEWQVLTNYIGWVGERTNAISVYKPSSIGYVFLKGMEENENKSRNN